MKLIMENIKLNYFYELVYKLKDYITYENLQDRVIVLYIDKLSMYSNCFEIIIDNGFTYIIYNNQIEELTLKK